MYVTEQCLGVHEEGSGSPSVAKFSVFLRNQAEKRLQEERERIDHYLDPSTEAKIREVTEKEMIAKHMRALAEMENSGCIAMFHDDKVEDLTRAYSLFKRIIQPISGLGVIRDMMVSHVTELGKTLVFLCDGGELFTWILVRSMRKSETKILFCMSKASLI